jgi:hypothetical protein
MFVVERVLNRGFFRDKVLLIATEDAALSRKRLGWDLLQAPDLKTENLKVAKGQQLIVSLAKNLVSEGRSISEVEITGSTAFSDLWKRAAA